MGPSPAQATDRDGRLVLNELDRALLGDWAVGPAHPVPARGSWEARLQALEVQEATREPPAAWHRELAWLKAEAPDDEVSRAKLALVGCGLQPDVIADQLKLWAQAVQRAEAAGRLKEATAYAICVVWWQSLGDPDTNPLPAADDAVRLGRRSENAFLLARALAARSVVQSLYGRQSAALPDLMTAQALFRWAGAPLHAESLVLDLGTAYRRVGELELAREYLQKSLQLEDEHNSPLGGIKALAQLAFLAEEQERFADMVALLQQAEERARRGGDTDSQMRLKIWLARGQVGLGDARAALRLLDQAEQEARALVADVSDEALLSQVRGQALLKAGRPEAALRAFDNAVDRFTRLDIERYLAVVLPLRAEAHTALGPHAQAAADLRRTRVLEERLRADRHDQATAWLRYRFDASRRDQERQMLLSAQAFQAQQLESAARTRRWQQAALGLGAVLLAGLAVVVWRLRQTSRHLREAAQTDALTGVLNRRGITAVLESAIAQASAQKEPLALMMLDVDHFKAVNDQHGHDMGDRVLRGVAEALTGALRLQDRLGRFGGEEFLVVLPGADASTAQQVAERLRRRVAALRWPLAANAAELQVTASYGLTVVRGGERRPDAALQRADRALYRAKDGGRDRGELEL